MSFTGTSNAFNAKNGTTDLRASSSLVANGETKIHRIYYLDWESEKLEKKLINIGIYSI